MLSVIMLNVIMLSVGMLSVVMLNVTVLSVIMLSVIMLSVIMPSVIMLSVVAPSFVRPFYWILVSGQHWTCLNPLKTNKNIFLPLHSGNITIKQLFCSNFKTLWLYSGKPLCSTSPRSGLAYTYPSRSGAVIYVFSYKVRVFVRLGWKSWPGKNTPAYYKNM